MPWRLWVVARLVGWCVLAGVVLGVGVGLDVSYAETIPPSGPPASTAPAGPSAPAAVELDTAQFAVFVVGIGMVVILGSYSAIKSRG